MNIPKGRSLSFSVSHTDYADIGHFSPILLDYLKEAPWLRPYYNRPPHLHSFEAQMPEKAASYRHRTMLKDALTAQYMRAGLSNPNIQLLSESNTFTITTGHQVCLFTGPVYTIYKIATAVKSCLQLKALHKDFRFVPVFWIATEDHDLAEANHFFLPQGKVQWNTAQTGAVGRMDASGMDQVLHTLQDMLGIGYRSAELCRMFEDCYLPESNIADAMRKLVHRLFGSYGVVVVDGDDPKLKALAIPIFEKELTQRISAKALEATNQSLSEKYSVQVAPREINLFYLDHGIRERIEPHGEGGFQVMRTGLKFSKTEIIDLLHTHPERFSPNVVLRPVYQEAILPNLAYIGGGGEVAYWLQLRSLFDAVDVPFPIVMLRNSALILSKEESKAVVKTGFTVPELLKRGNDPTRDYLFRESEEALKLEAERDALQLIFETIQHKLNSKDESLVRSVKSAHQRAQLALQSLELKIARAERRKHKVQLDRIEKLRRILAPQGGLQERYYNFATFYESYGMTFIDALVDGFNPFDHRFSIFEEL